MEKVKIILGVSGIISLVIGGNAFLNNKTRFYNFQTEIQEKKQ